MKLNADYSVSASRLGKAIILRWICPNLIFAPLFFFPISLLALTIAIIGRGVIARQLEAMFTKEWSYIYLHKYINSRQYAIDQESL